MTPQVFCGRAAVSVVLRHRSIALAPSSPAVVERLVSVESQPVGSSSPLPSQSSSIPSAGMSYAPGLMNLLQSLQSPSAGDHPSPSLSAVPEVDVQYSPPASGLVVTLASLVPRTG